MSLFNITFRKYNLKRNPYFFTPLSIGEGMNLFVGREEEIKNTINKISMGEGRFLLVGKSGVGKTTLLNYVRSEASKGQFFTTLNEIEINEPISARDFTLITLQSIYMEIKRIGLSISPKIEKELQSIYNITTTGNIPDENVNVQLSYERLKNLFRDTIKEIVHPRFKGIILHYDNLDNIQEQHPEEIKYLLGNIRDLLLTPKVIFFFVGNDFLNEDIGYEPRVRQIINLPPIEIKSIDLDNLNLILEKRLDEVKMNNEIKPIMPHTKESIKLLFNLHNGNLRETLKSLSACIEEIAGKNIPLIFDVEKTKKILLKKVKRDFLGGLSDTEKKILKIILQYEMITPSELSKISGKKVQNIASKYIPKLRRKGALEFIGKEGRNTYYKATSEILWWKLEKKQDKSEDKNNESKENLNNWL